MTNRWRTEPIYPRHRHCGCLRSTGNPVFRHRGIHRNRIPPGIHSRLVRRHLQDHPPIHFPAPPRVQDWPPALLDAHLQFSGGQLQQLHQLNLLRRELLEQFLLKALLEHEGRLKFCVLRSTRERNDIADVGHTGHVHHQPFKTHAKTAVHR